MVALRLREAVHNADVAETARLARNVNAWISKSSRKAASQRRPIGRCDGSHDENGERRSLTVPKLVFKGCLISADYNAYARCDQCAAAAEANEALSAAVQKASDRLELNKPTPQVVG